MQNKDIKAQITIGAILLIMAFAITVQIKSVSQNKSIAGTTNLRIDELLLELKNERDKNDELRMQVDAYKNDIDQYLKEAETTDNYSKILSEQLSRAELSAGMVDVKGEGITVTLNDAAGKRTGAGNVNANATLIHDEDIRKVVNELFAAGAEVIAVNDSRLISTSAVRCVGPSILVNDTKMTPPYTIKAIGKAEQLEAALNLNGGVIDNLKIWGFKIDIKRHDELIIPRYSGKVTYDIAKPIEKSGEDGQ
ncbi:MAG: DUF881 domain-containing protein [Ruminococcaceae bacterium]|nr:DUF881 domain-containing protein [Oscillospiraceae bacterium]